MALSLYRNFVFSGFLKRRKNSFRAAAAFWDNHPIPRGAPGVPLLPGVVPSLPNPGFLKASGTAHGLSAFSPKSWCHTRSKPFETLCSQPPGSEGPSSTHPCLIDRVVELRFYRDLAVGVRVHEGQAEAGVVPAPAGRCQGHPAARRWANPSARPPHPPTGPQGVPGSPRDARQPRAVWDGPCRALPGDVDVRSPQQQGDDEHRDEDGQGHVSPLQRCLRSSFCY